MIRTFNIHGKGNVISTRDIFPPIKLDSNYTYFLGLVNLYTCNTVRNIFEGNNKFHYADKEITIESGSYELDEIADYIKSKISDNPDEAEAVFKLRANNNTLKCEIESIYTIDFSKSGSIGRMLGFGKSVLKANTKHISYEDVDIISTPNIFIDTNITSGAYRNNILCHSIFEFGLSVPPGYFLEKEISHVIYFPVNVTEISNITLRFVDYKGNLIKLSDDTYSSVRLELKREY